MTSQSRARLRAWIATLLFGTLGVVGAPALADDYTLGQGLALGDSGITLGGYLTAEAQRLRSGESRFRSSHASVFAWWEGRADLERLKLLAEADLENAIVERRGPFGGETRAEQRLSLQRLHADWTVDDALRLRAGKFLTPVGRWNLSHAGPLVWTTNRPLMTRSVYPRQLTGLMAGGELLLGASSLGWSAYGSNGWEWDADPGQDLFASVRGLRGVLRSGGGLQVGLSWARYEQRGSRGEPRTLQGLDLLWQHRGFELQAEWLRTEPLHPQALPVPPRPGAGVRPTQRAEPTRGAYVQGVVPLGPWAPLLAQVSLVARHERLRDTAVAATFRQSTLGLAWRPQPALSLKAEYQWSRGRPDLAVDGWAGSVSVLF